MRHHINDNWRQSKKVSRGAFTLIEVLVSLAIFALLMAIILVPINLGFSLLHLGKASADVQSSSQRVIDRMRSDLTKAIYVYPNAMVPTVTGTPTNPKLPYGDPASIINPGDIVPVKPYFDADPCSATTRVSNLSRIDMLLPETKDGNILTPVLPTYYIVTYYARRLNVTPPNDAYQAIDNPIILYRAQIPFRGDPTNPQYLIDNTGNAVTSGIPYSASDSLNANIYNSRYTNLTNPTTACGAGSAASRSAQWLEQSPAGEPNLEPLTNAAGDAFTLFGSHVSMIPTGVGMVTGDSYTTTSTGYVAPKSTFICADTNRDGIIDQVTLNVLLQKLDEVSAQPKGQQITLPQVVDLPNVRSIANVR